MKMTLTTLLLALMTVPAFAQSEAPAAKVHDYTLLDVSYMFMDIDGISENGHAFGVAGSVQMNDWFHLWGSGSVATIDPITTTTIGIGVGAHTALTENVSTYARLGYLYAEAEVELETWYGTDVSLSADGDGYSLGAGIRAAVSPQLELTGGVSLVSFEGESDAVVGGGLLYSLTDNVALSASLSVSDDIFGAGVGMRFYFQ